MKKIKNIVFLSVFTLVLFSVSLACFLKPADAFSDAERRALAQMPNLDVQTLLSGEFMDGFETYTTDQFPARDWLRGFKAWWSETIFQKKDNNGLFLAEGHISKIDEPLNAEMLTHAAERFAHIYDTYLKDTDANVYFSVVPDKNMFLAEKNGYPSIDYPQLITAMREKTDYMEYIDILPLLSLEDYYTTDTHWRQEKITDVADALVSAMQPEMQKQYPADYYTVHAVEYPFYGVYAGQYARKVKADSLSYLTNSALQDYIVSYYDTGKPVIGAMYNMDKAAGKDPYEMFLSGAAPLIMIENPDAAQKRELVLFRDSFGSSIAPLLMRDYSKITLVDIRYIQSDFIGNFVDFQSADAVLFLYSSSLLNNSLALR